MLLTFLCFACIQMSLINAENDSTTDSNKVILENSKPSLNKSGASEIDKKFDRYPNQGYPGNNYLDRSQFYPNNLNNNGNNLLNEQNYPNMENGNEYNVHVQQPQYSNRPNQYYPSVNGPDTGYSNDNFNSQYPNQGLAWDHQPQSQQPIQNGFYNTGPSNQNGFYNLRRPPNGIMNTGRLDQNGFSNDGSDGRIVYNFDSPNNPQNDNSRFLNSGGQLDQNIFLSEQPRSNGFISQGRPILADINNQGPLNGNYQERPNQSNLLNQEYLQNYPNGFLRDQQPIGSNENWFLNRDINPNQYDNFKRQNWNNANGQMYQPNYHHAQETTSQPQRYPSEVLINNFSQENNSGPSKNIPGEIGIQNKNGPGDDNTAAILEESVLLPRTTASSDQIFFPDSSENASQKQCAQDCFSTSEYKPVCGTDKVTYINRGKLICARNCGISTNVLHNGPCEGD